MSKTKEQSQVEVAQAGPETTQPTAKQIAEYQQNRMSFYKANLPFLKAAVNHEELLARKEKALFEQHYYRAQLAQMQAPPSAEQFEEEAKRLKAEQSAQKESLEVVK